MNDVADNIMYISVREISGGPLLVAQGGNPPSNSLQKKQGYVVK